MEGSTLGAQVLVSGSEEGNGSSASRRTWGLGDELPRILAESDASSFNAWGLGLGGGGLPEGRVRGS